MLFAEHLKYSKPWTWCFHMSSHIILKKVILCVCVCVCVCVYMCVMMESYSHINHFIKFQGVLRCYARTVIIFFLDLSLFFRATPVTYGGFQGRGPIRAVVASLRQDHSNEASELHLQCQILKPLSKARDWTCILMDASHHSLTIEPWQELPGLS